MQALEATPKVVSLKEAVARFVRTGCSVGLGGQNIGRCAMAGIHEVIRQGHRDLTIYGCNLSISMDLLVGAGLVRRCESGTGNLERFGTTFCWRRGIENGTLEVEDYSHLAMVSRFLAGEMGVPFMPVKSLLGSDLLTYSSGSGLKKFQVIDNPWNPGEPVVLVPAVTPDVSIIHVQKADPLGNVIIEGFATHEPEMVRASRHTIVTCEELVETDQIRRDPERTTIPYPHVSAVVHQPWGAYPTSTYRYYDYDGDEITRYQAAARASGGAYRRYLDDYVYGCASFEDYLDKVCSPTRREELAAAMQAML
ncbi:MAG: CoA transferase subunit A [Candidatus Rokubacteria bacterium]|nr:CoA transferase subunit A [Candidatus Rokubacteria bacterium]